MLTKEKKSEIYACLRRQFPDPGIYKITRIREWLATNGYTIQGLGYDDFNAFAKDFPEAFRLHADGAESPYIILAEWKGTSAPPIWDEHPADSFYGSRKIILNDDIIEMSQQSLYALTKVMGTGLSVQEMKQFVYDSFEKAKSENTLCFVSDRYTFPIGFCTDGFLVNGIVTKNLSLHGKSLYFAFEKTSIYSPDAVNSVPRYHAPQPQSVGEDVKRNIYRILTAHFPFDRPQHMAAISKVLSDSGIDRSAYGFYKMKDLLAQMDYLTLEDVVLGGVPQIMVTINRSQDYPASLLRHEYTRSADYFRQGEYSRSAEYSHTAEYSRPAEYSSPVESADSDFVRSASYAKDEIPTERLEEFCNLPPKPVAIIMNYLRAQGQTVTPMQVREAVSEDFERARNGNIRIFDGKLIFPSHYLRADGTPVELTLKRSSYEGKPWFLHFVDSRVRNATRPIHPGKQLENFAFLGSWASFLSELAEKAVREDWDFAESPVKDNHILIQYIKYTFYRLQRENKVCISSDGAFAAFNTGLVDKYYNDIYACFYPNDPGEETRWKFAGFCTAASRDLGKQLISRFNPLPQPPKYVQRSEDLIFDLDRPMHTDFDHIIIDNIRRLPLRFLADQFMDFPEAQKLASEIETADYYDKKELYEQLKEIIRDNGRLYVRIQNRIKDAIELARKRVRWNYKTAIPSYYPQNDSMSLMLPLCLVDDTTPDVALVVELTNSGNYQGQTIITIPQAYIDARLLCRIDSEWLTAVETAPADALDEEME